MKSLLETAAKQTIGGRFKSLCIVGLNKVELINDRSDDSIFGDSWQDVTDEQTRKRMAMLFFAPRELDGEPISPARLLTEDPEDDGAILLTQQTIGGIPQLDLCRIPPADPNIVNFVVAADVIFHWDMKDSYVVPTTKFTWVKDIQRIMKAYPKSTQATVYTNWEAEKIGDLNLPTKHLRNLPLEHETWVNIPTFQEKNGTYVMLASFVLVILTLISVLSGLKQLHKYYELGKYKYA